MDLSEDWNLWSMMQQAIRDRRPILLYLSHYDSKTTYEKAINLIESKNAGAVYVVRSTTDLQKTRNKLKKTKSSRPRSI